MTGKPRKPSTPGPSDDALLGGKLADARKAVLATALPHVSFDGWTDATLQVAAKEAGVAAGEVKVAFPRGAVDLLSYWSETLDAKAAETLKREASALKVRERIAFGVRTRLELMAEHRIAARRGAAFLALPSNAATSAEFVFHTVDAIWRAAGDVSTDFNYYTKRALLAGVWSSTFFYWLTDDSDGSAETWSFLDRRIGDVMQIEKLKTGLSEAIANLPDPFKILGALRYPTR